MNDWYDYLIEENHQLQDRVHWLDDQLHQLEEADRRRESFLKERCKQSEYLISKHQRLLNKTSLLESHVEGLRNERDVFDDLRAIVEQYKQIGLKSVLKKDRSCSKHSHQVRFNDEANTEFIFDSHSPGGSDSESDKSCSKHSNPVAFNDEANAEVIFDCRPPGDSGSDSDRSSSKPSHPVRFNYEANAEIIFDCRPPGDSESDSDSQNEFHAVPKRDCALTKGPSGDATIDSGYSSGVEFEDCV